MIRPYENFTEPVEPEVGMGVTFYVGSDRYPGTVIFVNKQKTLIQITYDKIERDMSGNVFKPIYDTMFAYTYTLRKDGRWCKKNVPRNYSIPISFGKKDYYLDPSF